MKGLKVSLAFFVLPAFALARHSTSVTAAVSESRYSKAYSLGDNYVFDSREGWQSINATDLNYKYRRNLPETYEQSPVLERSTEHKNKSSIGEAISGVLKSVFKGLKGLGKPESVTITWYTGHDLKNPSCWSDGKWAPTDQSFACALTMEGWKSRPKCFKFLEVCKSPKKCVFVRVVDTCAGCAPGSKHIDLTRAAFGQLADYDVGVLQVNFRPATDPDGWHENLWGPKMDGK
ncbi:RlpA-like double-psi beta-barrel-protein domain-containing protein-containing protein [Gymnopilus junonius]|uniref:RlpA-like double-psi beta-barrel-protein domain-containing protein-containing protein n=1 Tax=Gymnopilus junonius TaxID=109634 RepID=A0A9P5P2M3_GYMJU|nr:RlpA-like double-psi beta-barrel-protein domain-containing protein-containing protein [Gymnopilus junonius]